MTEVSTLLNAPLWDLARWNGVAFHYKPETMPYLALVFANDIHGRQILADLRAQTGSIDEFELLRIAFLEGEIPGERSGYTVHISPNFDGIVAKARAEGTEPPRDLIMASRTQRVYPAVASPSLGKFKDEVRKHKRYFLVGASLDNRAIHFDVAIEKTLAIFKNVSDIGSNDVDKLIFARDAHQRPQ